MISWASNYTSEFSFFYIIHKNFYEKVLWINTPLCYSSLQINAENKKRPINTTGRFQYRSLTMSYFHTGIRTIIGAKAFHCPVRDGKEWYHLAMVIRHNLLPCWFLVKESTQRIHRVYQLHLHKEKCIKIYSITSNNFDITNIRTCSDTGFTQDQQTNQSYRVKPHEQLVSVSLTHYCASTPDLSTSWSWTTL